MRKILLIGAAGLAATLAAGTAQAQRANDFGYLAPDVGNVVGGGSATISGGGEDMVITYGSGGAGGGGRPAQPGWFAHIIGNHGDGPELGHVGPPPAGSGREAWLTGGGDDNLQVVYSNPATSRR
jgi:hypothetical protein